MRRMLATAATVLTLALAGPEAGLRPAAAATLAGVTFPDTYPVAGQTLRMNGIALRSLTILKVRAYVVALYLQQPTSDAAAILASPGTKVVLIQYLHDADKARIDAEFREGEKNNCGAGDCPKEDEADFERMLAAAPAVKVGDTSTFVIGKQNLQVYANNKLTGTYVPDLGRLVLAGFIGAHPPAQDVKAALLGAK